jgi:hypothetical protein
MIQPTKLFIPVQKIDADQRLVYGVLAAETADLSNEILDYDSSKAAFQEWSDKLYNTTGGKSKGNVRVMHTAKVAGHLEQIEFNDELKQVEICAKIDADDEWKLVEAGAYSGFSIGAQSAWRKKEKAASGQELTRYSLKRMIESSLVDLPCISDATFNYIKGGVAEIRKFVTIPDETKYVNGVSFKSQFQSVVPPLEKYGAAARLSEFYHQAAQSVGLKKSLWDVSDLAQVLMIVNNVRQSLKYEAEWEGDNSPIPEQLRTWLDDGAAILQDLLSEESSELTADAPSPDVTMAAEADVIKSTSATAENEEPMSDTKTEDGVVEAPVVEKVETVEAPIVESDVEKSVQKFVNEAVSTLNTKIGEQETVLKSLASSVETISNLLNTLKHLPAPFKGVVNTTAVAVSKEQDSAGDVQKVAPKDAMSAFKLALAPENAKSLDPRA